MEQPTSTAIILRVVLCSLTVSRCWSQACTDQNVMCGWWASTGECESNSVWMRSNCQKSCRICDLEQPTSGCKDLHVNCPTWLSQGECEHNAEFMLRRCPMSCEICQGCAATCEKNPEKDWTNKCTWSTCAGCLPCKKADNVDELDYTLCTDFPAKGGSRLENCIAGNQLNNGFQYVFNHFRESEKAACGKGVKCDCCRRRNPWEVDAKKKDLTCTAFPTHKGSRIEMCLNGNDLVDGYTYVFNEKRGSKHAACRQESECDCCRKRKMVSEEETQCKEWCPTLGSSWTEKCSRPDCGSCSSCGDLRRRVMAVDNSSTPLLV